MERNELAAVWVRSILSNRADKSWPPALYADAELAATVGEIDGMIVNADASLGPNVLEIRCARETKSPVYTKPFTDPPEPLVYAAGEATARTHIATKEAS